MCMDINWRKQVVGQDPLQVYVCSSVRHSVRPDNTIKQDKQGLTM